MVKKLAYSWVYVLVLLEKIKPKQIFSIIIEKKRTSKKLATVLNTYNEYIKIIVVIVRFVL